MTVDEFLKTFPDTKATQEQILCCRYLQLTGLRFLIDFGFQNAPDLTWDDLYYTDLGAKKPARC